MIFSPVSSSLIMVPLQQNSYIEIDWGSIGGESESARKKKEIIRNVNSSIAVAKVRK